MHLVNTNSEKKTEILELEPKTKSSKRTIKKAWIKYKNFYCLRHTYAKRLFENDVPLKTVQVLMGHSNIKTTANIYTHLIPYYIFLTPLLFVPFISLLCNVGSSTNAFPHFLSKSRKKISIRLRLFH